ncbi:39S ribosomal protein L1, mitochondrial isoform X1 [Chiloscyllium plagiosum]|uniref:39S ribosomal protein L1, mitochondrial isoform X1 n=1 Tax=Chiloscyllium plagiosum TaxID=36176 RepID=UPI001CB8550C|nr:39S ribosomal protein L1, mitochondrial isoform X1 [Chiloscyllium plagiosum]
MFGGLHGSGEHKHERNIGETNGMAAGVAGRLSRVFIGCHKHTLIGGYSNTGISSLSKKHLAVRQFAAVNTRAAKTEKKEPKEENVKPKSKSKTDLNRHKPYGLTAWEPVDDVYRIQYYPKKVHDIETAIDMLKKFQQLDFTYTRQPVYIDLRLDMKLEKKKKVDPFVSIVHLPYAFTTTVSKVLVFTESPEEAAVAQKHGADIVGGTDLIQKIMDDEIQADFYVSVPDMVSKLMPLKNKLRKKFPKSKRGSVGLNIPEMIEIFKTGHEYLVERDCYILTKVGTVDMPREHIVANVATIIKDVCTHRPVEFGPFVERAIICSATSESLLFKVEPFLPQVTTEDNEENENVNN